MTRRRGNGSSLGFLDGFFASFTPTVASQVTDFLVTAFESAPVQA
jgi:hypothetical protein